MDLIPISVGTIAVGIALFCAGALVALVIFCNPAGKGRRWIACLILAGASIGLLPLFEVMPPIHPTIESVSGQYIGNYAGGAETFDLRTDGIFLQSFVRDGSALYRNRGTWKVEGRGVTFYNIMVAYDGFGEPKTPEHIDVFSGAGLYLLHRRICFSEDTWRCIHEK